MAATVAGMFLARLLDALVAAASDGHLSDECQAQRPRALTAVKFNDRNSR